MKFIDSMIEGAKLAEEAGNLEYLNRYVSNLIDVLGEELGSPSKALLLVTQASERTNEQLHEEGY